MLTFKKLNSNNHDFNLIHRFGILDKISSTECPKEIIDSIINYFTYILEQDLKFEELNILKIRAEKELNALKEKHKIQRGCEKSKIEFLILLIKLQEYSDKKVASINPDELIQDFGILDGIPSSINHEKTKNFIINYIGLLLAKCNTNNELLSVLEKEIRTIKNTKDSEPKTELSEFLKNIKIKVITVLTQIIKNANNHELADGIRSATRNDANF